MKLNKFEQAKIALLVYSLKYQWVKELALLNNIDLNFGLSNNCSESEIKDYIATIKEESNTNIFLQLCNEFEAEDNVNKKIQIAQQVIDLKRKIENDNSN